jgi:hypothetical protein
MKGLRNFRVSIPGLLFGLGSKKEFRIGYGANNCKTLTAFDDIRLEMRIAHTELVYFKVIGPAFWTLEFPLVFYRHINPLYSDYRRGKRKVEEAQGL